MAAVEGSQASEGHHSSVSHTPQRDVMQERERQDACLQRILSETLPSHELADPNIFKDAMHAMLRDAHDLGLEPEPTRRLQLKLVKPTIVVAVIALMKSGKSTFLNALLGTDYLPSAAQPATASIARIVHSPFAKGGRLVVMDADGTEGAEFRGRKAIHECIKSTNDERRTDPSRPPARLRLEVNIPAFQCGAGGFELQMVDTPGPNEHGAGLEVEVNQVLRTSDVIFYILDYTKIGSSDEADMFAALTENVAPILRSTGNVCRIYYILNKVDNHSKHNDDPIEEILKSIAGKVQKLLPEGARVTAEDIIPVSAYNALLARQVCGPDADRAVIEDCLKKACGECWEDAVEGLPEDAWVNVAKKKAPTLEKRSGFDKLETVVMSQVIQQKHAICIMSFLDLLAKEMMKLRNERELEVGAAKSQVEDLRKAVAKMEETRATIIEQLKHLDKTCHDEVRKTQKSAQALFCDLNKDISSTVDAVFSARSEGGLVGDYIKPFFSVVKSLFVTVQDMRAGNIQDLMRKVGEANDKIAQLLSSKMENYRGTLNMQMYTRQHEIQQILKRIVEPLFKKLAGDAAQALHVTMKCEELTIGQDNFGNFQEQITGKMERLVQEKRERVRQTKTEYDEKNGACGSRWTESREVSWTEDQITGVSISKDSLKQVWTGQIATAIQTSQKSAELLIDREIRGEVERVRMEVTTRCNKYTETLQTEVKARDNSKEEKQANIDKLQGSLDKTEALLDKIERVQIVLTTSTWAATSSGEAAGHSERLRINMDFALNCGFDVVASAAAASSTEGPKNGLSPA